MRASSVRYGRLQQLVVEGGTNCRLERQQRGIMNQAKGHPSKGGANLTRAATRLGEGDGSQLILKMAST